MAASKYAAKVDANQAAIVQVLRDCGLEVELTHRLGKGFPDIVVGGYNRRLDQLANLLVEIKVPGKEDDLTADEVKWHARWRGPKLIASSAESVLQWFGLLE
jgi:hypothetical protein